MTSSRLLRIAALSGAATVALGAFGAHSLKPHLSDYQAMIFEKGVQYQFVHTLALLAVGILIGRSERVWLRRSGWLFGLGILFFSGSLYLLACRDLLPFPVGWAGPITPVGGLCFIGGWLALAGGLRR
jgi:uncharacterized membrane protein YgdD (TMEM256/DUF423 family)